jgi:hypothetical protein
VWFDSRGLREGQASIIERCLLEKISANGSGWRTCPAIADLAFRAKPPTNSRSL